jgi:hypothetical protein
LFVLIKKINIMYSKIDNNYILGLSKKIFNDQDLGKEVRSYAFKGLGLGKSKNAIELFEFAKKYPNDQDLGKVIRRSL